MKIAICVISDLYVTDPSRQMGNTSLDWPKDITTTQIPSSGVLDDFEFSCIIEVARIE